MAANAGHVKYIVVIGLIVSACLAGHPRQWPPLLQSNVSVSISARYLEPAVVIDASPETAEQGAAIDHRPVRPVFGMETEPVVGDLSSKWRAVELEIEHEEKVLAGCRVRKPCPEPARELLNIVAEGSARTGRARVGLINRAVNLAITPTPDKAQWGLEDHWDSPFETLLSHRGDCEDYAIVKYVALREAGLSSYDVKILILRILFPNEFHAVAAARVNGEWLILDNRRLTLVPDTDMIRATPKFLLGRGWRAPFCPLKSNRAEAQHVGFGRSDLVSQGNSPCCKCIAQNSALGDIDCRDRSATVRII